MRFPRFQSVSAVESLTDIHLFLFAIGYEERATFVASKIIGRCRVAVGLGFDHGHVLSYDRNVEWSRAHHVEARLDLAFDAFEEIVQTLVDQHCRRDAYKNSDPFRVCVDISCFDRARLASLVAFFEVLGQTVSVDVSYLYALGKFATPPTGIRPNGLVGTISPRYAGWFRDSSRPIALLVGLGYEFEKAVGAAEHLQASRIVAFMPSSSEIEYREAMTSANELLLQDLDDQDQLSYQVLDPLGALAMLDSCIRGLARTYNVVILPLGPKLFVLLSLIVFPLHQSISIWRVSEGKRMEPRNIKAAGPICGISLQYRESAFAMPPT